MTKNTASGQTSANRTKHRLYLYTRSGSLQLHCLEIKLTNLKLKTEPKQLLGFLPLDISLLAERLPLLRCLPLADITVLI